MRAMKHARAGLVGVSAMPLILAAPAIFPSYAMPPWAHDNTLTGLIPDLFAALDVVSRELVGFIPAVARNSTAERAAIGQAVKWPIVGAANVSDTTPAMTVPEPTGQTVGNDSISITKSRGAEFGFVGNEQRGLNSGPGYLSVQANMIAQAIRSLTNEIETDLAVEAIANASRGYGTVSTIPFASSLAATAQLRKILDDNGAPTSDRQLVINTTVGASLRTLAQLTKANEAADTTMLRQGVLLDLHGFAIGETQKSMDHTAGTGASATTTNAGFAVGATTIALASAGTGTILAGDLVTFTGDSEKYLVITGDADVSNGGSIVIAKPGLRKAIPASATNITVTDSWVGNVGFVRSAIQLATRAPDMPQEGDMRADSYMLTDPRSGLTFEVTIWRGYRKVRFEIALAWGVKATKREHISLLIH